MKKIFVIVVIALLTAACSSLKSGDSADRGPSDIKITLDQVMGSKSHLPGSSVGTAGSPSHGQGIETKDKAGIYRAQKQLVKLGYDPGPIDGLWGPKTQQAVKRYQQENSLPATGYLDHATVRNLMPEVGSSQKDTGGVPVQPQTYKQIEPDEVRQLVERHIRQKDIPLEASMQYRNLSGKTGSEGAADIFQGVRFDRNNYAVFALCEPNYRMVTPAQDLQSKLADLDISLPDEYMSYTFNGVFFTTVDLEVKTNPVFSYSEQKGFMVSDRIPAGGYRWMIGESGMKLGSTFVFFVTPSKRNIIESWGSETDEFAVKMSLPQERGILLDLYRP